ncbi:hypothetical protein MKW92_020534 [Papaver armeniacum]|nr:hypothetical protein MKW92_020534 [Papaver armeniacum]
MADIVKQILAKPIQLADQVSKLAEDPHSFKQECSELKSKTEKLAALLRQAARASSDLYERPTRRIIDDTEQVLDKALAVVTKCCASKNLMKRKMSGNLENSIGDVSWLLRVSAASADGREYLGLPPIAANEPILCLIWEQIATLVNGSIDDRSDAAASLVSLACDNDRYGKLIIEEGGVGPLLKLVKEGRIEGQENAARAIGLLGRDPESVEHMIHAGVCTVFKILKDGPMKVQSMVAWAVSELTNNHPKCQDHFKQNNIIRLLVGHLAFETIQEHSKYAITSNKAAMSIHSVVVASSHDKQITANGEEKQILGQIPHPMGKNNLNNSMHNVVKHTMSAMPSKVGQRSPSSPLQPIVNSTGHQQNHSLDSKSSHHLSSAAKGRELEDPATKTAMKAMAAKALWHLAKGNSSICKSITESRALLCFAVLLEKGSDDVQKNSAMALMEIASVAEEDPDLRRSAFKPNSPAAKAVVDQVLKVIENGDTDLLIPCIKAMGHLARTFKATETRIIGPLVKLLDEKESEITREAAIALTKFACSGNYLHLDHAKAIITAGGVKHLIQLVYFSEQKVQISSLVLLCYVAYHVPDSEELAQAEVLTVLEWASKQAYMIQHPTLDTLLPETKSRLELYQSRGGRGFY